MGAAMASALFAAGAANAAINVSIWTDQSTVAGDATLANIHSLGAANATTTVGSINFSTGDSTSTTVDQWLGTSIGGATGSHLLNNSVFEFTGSTFLNAGDNTFIIPHDDGMEISINGTIVASSPGATAAVNTPFTVNVPTAGSYNFDLGYGECCGGPAVLSFTVNSRTVGGIPEPASWAMMIVGMAAVGGALRSRRSLAAVAA